MKSIVLLSGGLDSVVALAATLSQDRRAEALFIDYGQKAAASERGAARRIARHYGIKITELDLRPLFAAASGNSALTKKNTKIPAFDPARFDDAGYQKKTAACVWVPNRNGLLVNAAACIAEARKIDRIVLGFNAEEGATFKDNTPGFVKAATAALKWSAQGKIAVRAPLVKMDKAHIVETGKRLGVPFGLVYSCYRSGKRMCGSCESCRRSVRAYKNAGLWDAMRCRFSSPGRGQK